MVAAIVGVATVATSAYSSSRSRSAAGRAADQQAQAQADQTALGREQLEFGREQYADWKDMFYPAMGDLRNMAYEEQRPDFNAIAADVGNAFDTSQGINRRTMQRFGVAPTDGAAAASETQYGLGRALATVGGFQQARTQAKDQQWNRLASFTSLGQGQQASALNTMNQGFGALGNAFGNQASMYGNQAQQYGRAAAAGAGMFGYGLNQISNSPWGQSFGKPAGGG